MLDKEVEPDETHMAHGAFTKAKRKERTRYKNEGQRKVKEPPLRPLVVNQSRQRPQEDTCPKNDSPINEDCCSSHIG